MQHFDQLDDAAQEHRVLLRSWMRTVCRTLAASRGLHTYLQPIATAWRNMEAKKIVHSDDFYKLWQPEPTHDLQTLDTARHIDRCMQKAQGLIYTYFPRESMDEPEAA